MAGALLTPARAAGFDAGAMLLLTDGTVLARQAGTSRWWRLSPDRAGQYAHGQWRPACSSRNAGSHAASAVLADGTVLVAGGNVPAAEPCFAELYDPVADIWNDLPAPDGWTAIGGAACCVLPDGRVLMDSATDNRCALFDPLTRRWTEAGGRPDLGGTREAWTLLPDGSVLAADGAGGPASGRFVNGSWIGGGSAPGSPAAAAAAATGPAILLPDGLVCAIGASGTICLFTASPVPGQPAGWTSGPAFPMDNGLRLDATGAPACLLPNGTVLCAAAPVDGTQGNPAGRAIFFAFDPVAGTLNRLQNQPVSSARDPGETRLLLLPTGEVLFSDGAGTLQIYQPDGGPRASWLPDIAVCPTEITGGETCKISGTQLNGLSQACAHGGDASVATNYPLVRLRSLVLPDLIVYCRTANHSTMGVATGTARHVTSFTVPPGILAGRYTLSVVANGMASPERPVTVVSDAVRDAMEDDARSRPMNERAEALQNELFWRDLNEVHLLMDFVSGCNDHSLAELRGIPDHDAPRNADGTVPDMAAEKIVQAVCDIRFPPSGSHEVKARQAALLSTVKDRLNALAEPAYGMTIAYTSMFSGVAAVPTSRGWRRTDVRLDPNDKTKYSFASEAYPNLVDGVVRFQKIFRNLSRFAVGWAIITAYFYATVAVTSTVVQQVGKLDSDILALSQPGGFTPTQAGCQKDDANTAACQRYADLVTQRKAAYANIKGLAIENGCHNPIGFVVLWFGPDVAPSKWCSHFADNSYQWIAERAGWETARGDGACAKGDCMTEGVEQLVVAVTGVFTGYILPIMFGLLGAAASTILKISGKIRESTLGPRDHLLSLASIPMGLVAGLAVGLIVTPSGAAAQSVAGTGVTLSATGLAFLAGYGAEAFFAMMDAVIKRIFSADPAKPADPQKPARP